MIRKFRPRLLLALLLSGVLVSFPGRAHASHDGQQDLIFVFLALPSTLGITIVAPLVGLGIDKASGGENSPYWSAVGFTLAAASTATYMAYQRDNSRSPNSYYYEAIAFPIVAGTITTTLVYLLWPRSGDDGSEQSDPVAPRIGFMPVPDGGRLALNWRF